MSELNERLLKDKFEAYLKNQQQPNIYIDGDGQEILDTNLSNILKLTYSNEDTIRDYSPFEEFYSNLTDNYLTDFYDLQLYEYINDKIDSFTDNEEKREILRRNIGYSFMDTVNPNTPSKKEVFDKYRIYLDILLDQENLNSECSDTFYAIDHIKDFLESDETIFRDEEELDEITKALFESQGYKIEDLKNQALVEDSKFLQSFINEIDEIYTNCSYVYVANLSVQELIDMTKANTITIKKGAMFGLFGPIFGDGAMVDIILEKDLTLPTSMAYLSNHADSSYGYSTFDIYGELVD